MEFPQYEFDSLNETDVREEIIAPLLRHLGYRSGTKNNIVREQSLAYPNISLGRKKKTDPILRGRADYICTAEGQLNWVIETKSPNAELDNDTIEQSWSYANHPEIRAVYFCLSNGACFQIYQTNRGPGMGPIFQCSYEDMKENLSTICNILTPEAILRDHKMMAVDNGIPIGPGLRSIVRITNGSIIYHSNTLNLRPLIGLTMSITDGSVERNEKGTLEAYIETLVPYQSLQKLNERLGLHSLLLFSNDESVSTNPDVPTVFVATTNHILPKGEMVLDLSTWKENPFPMNMRIQARTIARGYLEKSKFKGKFKAVLLYQEVGLRVVMDGSLNVHLS